jgi:hypothetical protein
MNEFEYVNIDLQLHLTQLHGPKILITRVINIFYDY